MKRSFVWGILLILSVIMISGCAKKQEQETDASYDLDYMVLVNKLNPLPEDWEDKVQTVHTTNSLGDDVEVEKAAYDAYLLLKEELEEEGVFVDLDSARRTVEAQQKIVDDFTEKYGEAYTAKTVAVPGYSEHHTGLALDLYLIVDGKNVVENEDMVQYTEIWSTIHEKLAEHGFILRYLDGREHITGYGYEPWHIRYINDKDTAKEIEDKGITLEEYLGKASSGDITEDYGDSDIFTEEELKEAFIKVKCLFASWEGCTLSNIRYAGDEYSDQEKLDWLNTLEGGGSYTKAVLLLTDFKTPKEGFGTLKPDSDYMDYQWWLAINEDGEIDLVTFGYGGL